MEAPGLDLELPGANSPEIVYRSGCVRPQRLPQPLLAKALPQPLLAKALLAKALPQPLLMHSAVAGPK